MVSLPSIAGKVYDRIEMDCLWRISEPLFGEKQGGLRRARRCVDQIFSCRQVVEKIPEKR